MTHRMRNPSKSRYQTSYASIVTADPRDCTSPPSVLSIRERVLDAIRLPLPPGLGSGGAGRMFFAHHRSTFGPLHLGSLAVRVAAHLLVGARGTAARVSADAHRAALVLRTPPREHELLEPLVHEHAF